MKLTVLAVVLGAGLASAQIAIEGGQVSNTFTVCNYNPMYTGHSCGVNTMCCTFTDSSNSFTSDFCMSTTQSQGHMSGTYQDTQNYPYAVYNWNCGERYYDPAHSGAMIDGGYINGGYAYDGGWVDPMMMGNHNYADIAGLPAELINNGNWFALWYLLMTFIGSGGWLFGYVLFIPAITLAHLWNFCVSTYGLFIVLFEHPTRLNFQEWIFYPVRRQWVLVLIASIASIFILIPGVSAFGMPVLGAWAINDFLDYQGWNQVGYTLSLPFMGMDAWSTGQPVYTADPYYDPYMAPATVIV